MEPVQRFKDKCETYNLNFNELFTIGKSKSYVQKGKGQSPRFVNNVQLSCANLQNRPSLMYAIRYYEEQSVYIAWSYKAQQSRTCFSIIAGDALNALGDKVIGIAEKGVGFRHRIKEHPIIFKREGIDDFIKIVKKELSTQNK